MDPEWKDAPEWANYLTMDGGGEWAWFENKPHYKFGIWIEDKGKIYYIKNGPAIPTIEKRPEKP